MPRRTADSTIQTSTSWEDAGYDCDHCGGRILRRTDRETGLRDKSCFQCEQCGCQWTLERRPLRVGKMAACRAAQRGRAAEAEAVGPPYARWLLVVLGAVVALGLLRFGGGAFVRALLPLLLVGLAAAAIWYVGRRNGRW